MIIQIFPIVPSFAQTSESTSCFGIEIQYFLFCKPRYNFLLVWKCGAGIGILVVVSRVDGVRVKDPISSSRWYT